VRNTDYSAEILTLGRESSRQVQDLKTRELNNISKIAFLEGMNKLKERANKCIDQGGIYILKNKNKLSPFNLLAPEFGI
jgi:hypothetical protein